MRQVEIIEIHVSIIGDHIVITQRCEDVDILDDFPIGFEVDVIVIITGPLMYIAHMDHEVHFAFIHARAHLLAYTPLCRGINTTVS